MALFRPIWIVIPEINLAKTIAFTIRNKSEVVIKRVAIFIIVIALSFASSTKGISEEAEGFRGISWGTDFSLVKDVMIHPRTDPSYGGVKFYSRKDDPLEVGGVTLTSIQYGFWQNKLSDVDIKFAGYDNFNKLKKVTAHKYGRPDKPNKLKNKYYWFTNATNIVMEYNKVLNQGYMFISSEEIINRQEHSTKKH